jgi:SNF2 family DNA or RNA helicase
MEPLFKHQEEFLATDALRNGYGFWHEMGTGKTRSVLENAKVLHQGNHIDAIIVLASSNVYLNWYREFTKWWPEVEPAHWYAGNPTKAKRAIEALHLRQGCKALLCNVEALADKAGVGTREVAAFVKKYNRRIMMVIDESNIIGNPAAGRTKVIMILGKGANFRRALSGTPGIETPLKLYTQLEFLRPGITGMTYYQYRSRVAEYKQVTYGNRQFPKLVGYRNIDWVRGLMHEVGSFKSKKECLDLPPKLYEMRLVPLDDKQEKVYKELKKAKMSELESGLVIPANGMEMMHQLHNVSTGFVKTETGIEWISMARVNALIALIDELPPDAKIIIFSPSRPELQMLDDTLVAHIGPQGITRFHGGVDIDTRNLAVDEFQNKVDVRIFLANQMAAGLSLTLTAASYIVYFRNAYSLELRVQSEDRAHRAGQLNAVTIIDMCAPGTVDEHVIKALHNKYDVAGNIIPFLKETLTTTG